jgi:SPP1 gp7 family putative phage head morphogenesis protein
LIQDPTQTITLRRRFVSSVNRRFRELKTAIRNYLVTENRLDPITINVFRYRNSQEKHQQFMDWLKEMQESNILEISYRSVPFRNLDPNQPWINTYIWSAYQKGLVKGRMELRAKGHDIPQYMRTDEFVMSPLFHSSFHSEEVALAFTRVFTDLKGITEAMDTQISRTLAQGMSEGLSASQIARNIVKNVDNIGIVRARVLARTEVVRAHNEAKLNDYQAMEDIIGESVFVKWRTAQDERVRHPRHTSRHGKIYRKRDARRLLGEPNCRCALRPYLQSVDGDIQESQWGPINTLSGR